REEEGSCHKPCATGFGILLIPTAVAVTNGPPGCQVWGLGGSVMADNRRVRVGVAGVVLGAVVGCALGIAPIAVWVRLDRAIDQGALLSSVTVPEGVAAGAITGGAIGWFAGRVSAARLALAAAGAALGFVCGVGLVILSLVVLPAGLPDLWFFCWIFCGG